jgi:putative transposase
MGAKQKIKKATYPLEKAWVDYTVLDVMVVDDKNLIYIGKPTLITIVDEFSGYPLGYHLSLDSLSYDSVRRTLRHAIFPKHYMEKEYPKIKNKWDAYGIPETLVVDSGKEFVNDSFKDFCFQLGITIEHRPLAKSEFKGGI